jgi:hypothetical protein
MYTNNSLLLSFFLLPSFLRRYVDTCRKIVGATRKIGRAVEDMPELILLGDPQVIGCLEVLIGYYAR